MKVPLRLFFALLAAGCLALPLGRAEEPTPGAAEATEPNASAESAGAKGAAGASASAGSSGSGSATVAQVITPAVLPGDQTILLITVEDDGSRIEELRYGGITESITVSPKLGLPSYEVKATDGAHSHPVERNMTSAPLGVRLWNLFDF